MKSLCLHFFGIYFSLNRITPREIDSWNSGIQNKDSKTLCSSNIMSILILALREGRPSTTKTRFNPYYVINVIPSKVRINFIVSKSCLYSYNNLIIITGAPLAERLDARASGWCPGFEFHRVKVELVVDKDGGRFPYRHFIISLWITIMPCYADRLPWCIESIAMAAEIYVGLVSEDRLSEWCK